MRDRAIRITHHACACGYREVVGRVASPDAPVWLQYCRRCKLPLQVTRVERIAPRQGRLELR